MESNHAGRLELPKQRLEPRPRNELGTSALRVRRIFRLSYRGKKWHPTHGPRQSMAVRPRLPADGHSRIRLPLSLGCCSWGTWTRTRNLVGQNHARCRNCAMPHRVVQTRWARRDLNPHPSTFKVDSSSSRTHSPVVYCERRESGKGSSGRGESRTLNRATFEVGRSASWTYSPVVRRQGIEPRTRRLRVGCSATELAARDHRRAGDRNRTGIHCLEGSNTSHCVTPAGPGDHLTPGTCKRPREANRRCGQARLRVA